MTTSGTMPAWPAQAVATKPVASRGEVEAFVAYLAEQLGAALDTAVNYAACDAQLSNSTYMALRRLLVGGGPSAGLQAATVAAARRILEAALGDAQASPIMLLE